jgi:hypothetical protein
MNIKGAVMLARQREIVGRFGQERWTAFLAGFSARHERFEDSFFLTSRIPLESFLEFQDALIAEFYGGDERQYLESGRAAAKWAFSEGPYMRLFDGRRNLAELLESGPPRMWENYFDFGRLVVRAAFPRIEVSIEGLPSRHPYFLLSVPGFMLGALEVLGAVDPTCEEAETDRTDFLRWVFHVPGWREGEAR